MSSDRICVFGTSNGLFKDGYVAGLADTAGAGQCDNFSVGASSSFIWFVTSPLAQLDRYGWAVLDYCVNDGLMLRGGANTLHNWRGSLLASIAELRAAGCEPILLILPSLAAAQGNNPLLPAALELARDCRLPFYDGYAMLSQVLQAEPSLTLSALFRDPAHLHPALSRLIGQQIAAALARLPPRGAHGETVTAPLGYRYLDVADWRPADTVVERATSLMRRRFSNLAADAVAVAPVAAHERVVGVALDLSKSTGTMVMQGSRTWEKSWTNIYHKQWLGVERAMVFSVMPIGGGVSGAGDAGVTLRLRPDHDGKPNESWGALDAEGAEPPALALSGLLVESEQPGRAIPLPYQAAPDLLALIGPEGSRAIAAAAVAMG